jgi:hypothetical protein
VLWSHQATDQTRGYWTIAVVAHRAGCDLVLGEQQRSIAAMGASSGFFSPDAISPRTNCIWRASRLRICR